MTRPLTPIFDPVTRYGRPPVKPIVYTQSLVGGGNMTDTRDTVSSGTATAIPPTPGPLLWLDASDETTIDATGGLVDQWNDKSAYARNLAGGGTGRPTTGVAVHNLLNAVHFSGGQVVNGAHSFIHDSMIDTGVTIYIVSSRVGGSWAQTLVGEGGLDTSKPYIQLMNGFSTTPSDDYMGAKWQQDAGAAVFEQEGSALAYVETEIHLVRYELSASLWRWFIDGAGSADHSSAPSSTPTTTMDRLSVGALVRGGNVTNHMNGDICEVKAYAGNDMGAAAIASIESELITKWGI